MIEFTKEQLIGIIESADDVLQALAGTHDDIHPDSDKMCEAWNYLNDNAAPPAVVKRLAEIALASLTAEPVAWISERNLKNLGKSYSVYVKHEPVMVRPIPLYAAPPAPVVPDEWRMMCGEWRDEKVSIHDDSGLIVSGVDTNVAGVIVEAHNACRAAISYPKREA